MEDKKVIEQQEKINDFKKYVKLKEEENKTKASELIADVEYLIQIIIEWTETIGSTKIKDTTKDTVENLTATGYEFQRTVIQNRVLLFTILDKIRNSHDLLNEF